MDLALFILVFDLPDLPQMGGHSVRVFRNEIVAGNGGKQILLEDPDGNLVELYTSLQMEAE